MFVLLQAGTDTSGRGDGATARSSARNTADSNPPVAAAAKRGGSKNDNDDVTDGEEVNQLDGCLETCCIGREGEEGDSLAARPFDSFSSYIVLRTAPETAEKGRAYMKPDSTSFVRGAYSIPAFQGRETGHDQGVNIKVPVPNSCYVFSVETRVSRSDVAVQPRHAPTWCNGRPFLQGRTQGS